LSRRKGGIISNTNSIATANGMSPKQVGTSAAGGVTQSIREHVLQWVDGDTSLLAELCAVFLEESPQLMARLKEALQRGQAQEVCAAAHALKGELAYFGTERSRSSVAALEAAGRGRQLALAAELFETLSADFERSVAEVEALAKELGDPGMREFSPRNGTSEHE
jgi:HPt (histidine-containing phosphotransfer) domain-containing protein